MYRGWYRALLGGSGVLLGGSWPALVASARSWTPFERFWAGLGGSRALRGRPGWCVAQDF